MWSLYDDLIDSVSKDITVESAVSGRRWTMLRTSDGRTGVAMTMEGAQFPSCRPESLVGTSLQEAAALVKSWNFADASFGTAALNAFYNTAENAARLTRHISPTAGTAQEEDAFVAYQPLVEGKKVAVIGHFPMLERSFSPICTLSILERDPRPGDYPDSASEFLLPEQDYVFITGCTLTNKTLPRLLQLSQNAHTILVGPSTPLSPVLFFYGVNDLSGFVVKEETGCREAVERDANLFDCGKMVRILG